MGRKLSHISPGAIIFASYALFILLGTLALMHPACQTIELSFFDLLFTATSATCVTGLFTVSIDNFTGIGKGIILLLIQVGGLGLITLSVFAFSLFRNLGLGAKLLAGQMLEIEKQNTLRSIILFIVGSTLVIEILGAISYTFFFLEKFSLSESLLYGAFYAVSSFCNAGISLISDSICVYGDSALFLITSAALMLIGGLGFVTWYELCMYTYAAMRHKRYSLPLHVKIVVYGSCSIILATMFLFLIFESNNTLAFYHTPMRLLHSFFHAVSFRSTGFLALPLLSLHPATLLLALLVSFIGSAPLSTGSGIKVTTFSVILATLFSALSGRLAVNMGNRQLVPGQIYKAFAIVMLSIFWIIFTIFYLVISDGDLSFFEICCEAISALSNLGISTGVTPMLSVAGKIIIMISMFIGRIGSVTLVLALRDLAVGDQRAGYGFSYPEERIMLS